MTIKKYELSDAISEQSLQSSTESHAMMAQAPEDPPVSFTDFIRMMENGTWQGGNVAGLGYVGEDDFEKTLDPGEYSGDYYYNGQITRFVRSSHANVGFDFDTYLSDMYSLMYVATVPENGSSSSPESSSNNQNGNGFSNDNARYYRGDNFIVDGVTVGYEVIMAGSYTLVSIDVTKESGPSCVSIKCTTGIDYDRITEVVFDSSNNPEPMNKRIVATKAYYDPLGRHLMTLEIYQGVTCMHTIFI